MPTRRTFLASGLAASAGAGAWASLSSSWGARFIRERIAEFGKPIPAAPHTPSPERWADNAITIAWLGHATVLINFYGLRILTDPTFFPRIGVTPGWAPSGRCGWCSCALAPEAMPDIDLLLVTHAHFDHLDTPSLAAVPGTPAVVMAHGTSDLLPRRGPHRSTNCAGTTPCG